MKINSLLAAVALATVTFCAPAFGQILWTNHSPAGINDDIWCVTYANGMFAATTSQGRVLSSSDGLTWSSQVADQGVSLVSIAYGNGSWVAVGAGGTILVSADLKTWVNAASVTANKLNGVIYTGSLWVAVGDSATIVTSPDALNWTIQTLPAGSQVTGFLHGIAVLPANNDYFGQPGVLISGAQAGNGSGSVDTGVILAMATTPSPNSQTYSVSVVGIGQNITGQPASVPGNLEAIQLVPDLRSVVAVGWEGTILYAPIPNEAEGSLAPNVPSVVYRGLAYGAGYWVAAGETGTILTSTDGLAWTQRFSGDSPSTATTSTLLSATYAPTLQRFVIVGAGGTILVSNPAASVFANISTRGLVSKDQSFIGGFVIEGTAPRTILIRADGPALAQFGVTGTLSDPVLTVFDNNQAVVATNTGWGTNSNASAIATAALATGAFPLPNSSADSALLLILQPGAYTAVITSAGGNSGSALFEAYTD
ncbi:MAG TPA: hypothetical protein VGF85_12510 [Opitutaceae bacterium]